jgi:hypothetical protein
LTTHDPALDVLKRVHAELRADIPWAIVEQAYEIERSNQYEKDREVASSDLRRLITLAVEKELEGDAMSTGAGQ